MNNLYELLELDQKATQQQIKKSYRRLALLYHPDRVAGNTEQNSDRFKDITRAYNVLKNPLKRSAYDQKLKHKTYAEQTQYSKRHHYQQSSHQKTQTNEYKYQTRSQTRQNPFTKNNANPKTLKLSFDLPFKFFICQINALTVLFFSFAFPINRLALAHFGVQIVLLLKTLILFFICFLAKEFLNKYFKHKFSFYMSKKLHRQIALICNIIVLEQMRFFVLSSVPLALHPSLTAISFAYFYASFFICHLCINAAPSLENRLETKYLLVFNLVYVLGLSALILLPLGVFIQGLSVMPTALLFDDRLWLSLLAGVSLSCFVFSSYFLLKNTKRKV